MSRKKTTSISRYIRESCAAMKLVISQVIAIVIAPFYKHKKIWLISEKKTEARDNGFHFYSYLQLNHKEIRSYYVIRSGSADEMKVKSLGKVIPYDSWAHCVLYFVAQVRACSQVHGVRPFEEYSGLTKLKFIRNPWQKQVHLKHGISKDDLTAYDYRIGKYDLMICGAKPEYEYIKCRYNYPDNKIAYTGLCRFDLLHDTKDTENIILIMPTFRKWLRTSNSEKQKADKDEEERFLHSDFYREYCNLLKDESLLRGARTNCYKIVFYLHYTLQPYKYLFDCFGKDDFVIIADREKYDVQDLLIRSKLLITDYSSVFFDFAYMKKPLVYFQFDKMKYRENHYKKGWFSYEEDGFGPVFEDLYLVVDYVVDMLSKQCCIDDFYFQRTQNVFELNDAHNCQRVYEAIQRIL